VQPQAQPFHDETQATVCLVRLRPRAAQHDKVVAVPHEDPDVPAATLPDPIESVEVDVREQRSDHAALGRAQNRMSHPAFLHHARLQPHPQELPHPSCRTLFAGSLALAGSSRAQARWRSGLARPVRSSALSAECPPRAAIAPFPAPPLRFRTVGFPQYGSKVMCPAVSAGLPDPTSQSSMAGSGKRCHGTCLPAPSSRAARQACSGWPFGMSGPFSP
jgi:hypothetical protein